MKFFIVKLIEVFSPLFKARFKIIIFYYFEHVNCRQYNRVATEYKLKYDYLHFLKQLPAIPTIFHKTFIFQLVFRYN